MARALAGVGFVEIGAGQAEEASAIFTEKGLEVVRVAPDLAGIPRVLVTRYRG
jgi:methylase of polypeptide subunit release factors